MITSKNEIAITAYYLYSLFISPLSVEPGCLYAPVPHLPGKKEGDILWLVELCSESSVPLCPAQHFSI